MATRMQQRRGTAAQWTAANPILAAGEIGFETDTSKFKMGNGSSAWSALTYFANAAELSAIIDGAPDLLNTLNELAASIGDDPSFLTTMASNLNAHESDTTNVHGVANMAALATTAATATAIETAVSTHQADTTGVHGIADTSALAIAATVATDISTAVSTHNSDITNVHGIADTSLLATTGNLSAHVDSTTGVHGIADTSLLATTANVATAVSDAASALTTHNSDSTMVHGIADTAALALLTDVSSSVSAAIATEVTDRNTAISSHNSDTTDVHGIGDTSLLATLQNVADAVAGATVDQSALAGAGIDWNLVSEAFDVDETVISTRIYAAGLVSTHQEDTTNVHGISDTSLLATTANVATAKSEAITEAGTAADTKVSTAVAALTKSSVGLANVDNTADASKPVSTAQASAIATAKAEAIADATAQVDALLTGAPAALNTLDELAAALGDDANFASTVTTSLGLKAPLASPTFTGTVTVAASGVAFTDGTQTKEGVASRTPIVQKTAAYTLSELTERDSLIEVSSATGVTITIPTNTAVAYPVGTSIDILQTGAGQVTIAPVDGTVTVNATPGLKLRTTWSSATLFKRAANTWVVFGDLTA